MPSLQINSQGEKRVGEGEGEKALDGGLIVFYLLLFTFILLPKTQRSVNLIRYVFKISITKRIHIKYVFKYIYRFTPNTPKTLRTHNKRLLLN